MGGVNLVSQRMRQYVGVSPTAGTGPTESVSIEPSACLPTSSLMAESVATLGARS